MKTIYLSTLLLFPPIHGIPHGNNICAWLPYSCNTQKKAASQGCFPSKFNEKFEIKKKPVPQRTLIDMGFGLARQISDEEGEAVRGAFMP